MVEERAMSERLKGRAALVTGSTSNIGMAIAIRFAAEGAPVVITGRDAARGRAVADAVRADGGEVTFLAHELDGSVDRTRELAALATTTYGPIEILVNNAGIYPPDGTLAIDGETFDRIVAVNVKVPYFLTAALVPAMIDAGRGVVINLGSWGARLGIPGGTAYASTKGAMETLTRAWAAEFGAKGIRVNAISPGVTFDGASPVAEIAGPMMATTPLGRMVAPEAIARAAVFLASDDAADIHGTVLDVDGARSSVLFAAR
jgi:NAD(P)-dependent dehydrogenase (short-subunit alcohol dehydrogenase family)